MLQPEQIDHINYLNWFKETYPIFERDIYHFANERKCSAQQGRILKRMGVVKGVLDFFLAIPNNPYHGFWLELKVGKNTLTKEQNEFIERNNKRGYCCVAAWGENAAKELTKVYLLDYNAFWV